MTPKEIGNRITMAREEARLTKKELSEKIHVAASTITRYEHGEIGNIKLPVISAIASALSVNPLWLVGKSDHKLVSDMKQRFEDNFKVSEKEKELIKKYRQLPQTGKAAVDTMLDVQYDLVKPKLSVDTETS